MLDKSDKVGQGGTWGLKLFSLGRWYGHTGLLEEELFLVYLSVWLIWGSSGSCVVGFGCIVNTANFYRGFK